MGLAKRRSRAIACIMAILSASAGCVNTAEYQAAISQNRANIRELQLGMSGADVNSMMSEGASATNHPIQLSEAWKSESFLLRDERNTRVDIFYYITELPSRWKTAADHELTPIVLEDDQVVGWGWPYLQRNTDRYAISTRLEQESNETPHSGKLGPPKVSTHCTFRGGQCGHHYQPVCAFMRDKNWRTFPNGCQACADFAVTGYREGHCK